MKDKEEGTVSGYSRKIRDDDVDLVDDGDDYVDDDWCLQLTVQMKISLGGERGVSGRQECRTVI